MKRVLTFLVTVGLLGTPGMAFAGPLTIWDFAVFSGGGLTTNGSTNPETRLGVDVKVNGLVGTNQDMALVGGSQVNAAGVYVGGYLDMGENAAVCFGAMPCSAGPSGLATVIVNGANTNSGQAAHINGDIYGNLFVTGNVTLQDNADILQVGLTGGNLEYTGLRSNFGTPVVQGTSTQVGATTTFSPFVVPAASVFSASANAVDDRACTGGGCTSLSLAPGTYRDLNIGSNKELYLSSGNYYFRSIDINSDLVMNLDLTSGPINIFVTGVANFGSDHTTMVKGAGTGGLYVLPGAAPNLAALVYLETHDKFNVNSGSQWAGTVFASQFEADGSDETYVGIGIDWWGAIYAFDSLNIRQDTELNFVQSYRAPSGELNPLAAVPEPSSLFLLGAGILGLATAAHRRRTR